MTPEGHKNYSKEWYQRNKERAKEKRKLWQQQNKEKQRQYSIKNRHGISAEDYDAALKLQGGVCAICSSIIIKGKNCHLDHCHKTGKFRGFLCSRCNKGLGAFQDNQQRLAKAINYLQSAELIFSKIV